MLAATFSGSYTAYHISAVFNHLRGMKSAFCARKTLNKDFGVFIYKNAHMQIYKVAAKLGDLGLSRSYKKAISKGRPYYQNSGDVEFSRFLQEPSCL